MRLLVCRLACAEARRVPVGWAWLYVARAPQTEGLPSLRMVTA